ncbi:META domain-containing protein [Cellulomonas shaoxiangyii]|uniref:META domain-containing protein n=1 Tax=Cellulomonas shaoxiangyii TaxID=2566013 RepID=A0A4P7SJ35_9CELL|nr:META domain-containing protein [Cellulomonas shaoxiangyii]QCB93106.1 META domain-containing protein [Cellulomonas shaoxiangyii]TGY84864.1 META domain-containing protein [Cellulomonas shaoxiangyii]
MRDDQPTDDVPTTVPAGAPDPTAGDAPPDAVADGDAPWLHGTWHVAEVDGAALADGLEGPAWLTFEGDGQVYGYAGVNHVRATWRVRGDRLEVGPVVQTMMAGPPAPTATEQAVTAVLGDGGTLEAAGDEVRLRTPAGRLARLVRTAPSTVRPEPDAGPHVLA